MERVIAEELAVRLDKIYNALRKATNESHFRAIWGYVIKEIQAAQCEWLPIAEAPRGKSLLLFPGWDDDEPETGYFSESFGNRWVYFSHLPYDGEDDPNQPTHFRYLPPGPEMGGG